MEQTLQRQTNAGVLYSAKRPFRVLDAGCGEGRNAFELERRLNEAGVPCRVVGVDESGELISLARQTATKTGSNAVFEQGGMASLPFADGSFDFILSQAAFHHLTDRAQQARAGSEFARVLAPNGGLWMSVYNYNAKRLDKPAKIARDAGTYPVVNVPWRTSAGKTFDRWYYLFQPDELRKLLTRVGFTITDSYVEKAGVRLNDGDRTAYNFAVQAVRN